MREVRSAKAARALVRGAFPKPEHRQIAIVLWLTGIDSAMSSKPKRKTVLLRDVEPLIAIGKTVLSLAYEAARKRHEQKIREREEKDKAKGKEKNRDLSGQGGESPKSPDQSTEVSVTRLALVCGGVGVAGGVAGIWTCVCVCVLCAAVVGYCQAITA